MVNMVGFQAEIVVLQEMKFIVIGNLRLKQT
uniref:Uncharacterized protein n=1 Tax=Tetranychus urticae TaxID=32264 RepID=T1KRZ4_TETUR